MGRGGRRVFYFQRAAKVNSSDFSPVRRLLDKHSLSSMKLRTAVPFVTVPYFYRIRHLLIFLSFMFL
jgi:hypothetical protein